MKSDLISGRYKVLRELGVGSSGSTYLVEDQEASNQVVALKSLSLPKASEEIALAFRSECKLLQQLSHPNVARLFEYGEDRGRLFYTTEYVEGEDFVQACRSRDWNAVFALTVQACWALEYLHSHKIIHRDIKPANMLVGKIYDSDEALTMERLRLKIIDFGLAVSTESRVKVTEAAGTLGYMAPEVLAQRSYDQRADLYSLGVVLYEAALGRLPTAKTQSFSRYLEALHHHEVDMSPLRESDETPKGIIGIIDCLILKDPNQRLQGAHDVVKLLNEIEGEAYPLSFEKAPVRQPKKTRKTPKKERIKSQRSKTTAEKLDRLLQMVRSGKQKEARSFIESNWPDFKSEGDQLIVETFYATAGYVFIEQGCFTEARNLIAELAMHPAFKGKSSIGRSILNIQLSYREGKIDEAKQILRDLPSGEVEAASLEQQTCIENYKGLVMQGLKEYESATEHFEKAANMAEQSGRVDHQMSLLTNAASLYYEQGRWIQAYEVWCHVEGLARQTSNMTYLATILNNLGNLFLYFGRLREAEKALEESLEIAREQSLQSLIAYNLYLLSSGEIGKGNRERVEDYLQRALEYGDELGSAQAIFQAQLAQGYILLSQGDAAGCKEAIQVLREHAKKTDQQAYELQVDWLEAKFRIQEGSYASHPVSSWLSLIKEDALKRKKKNNLWQILKDQGDLLHLQGDIDAAKSAYKEALQVIDEIKENVPKKFQQSFLRDRKKEKIRVSLDSLTQEDKSTGVSDAEPSFSFKQWSDINRRLLMQHDIDQLLEEILDASLTMTDAERGFVILSDHQQLDIRAARNFDRQTLNPDSEEFSYTIARDVMRKGESAVSLDAAADERFAEAQSVHVLKIRSVLCVPLRLGQRTVGLIYLDNRYRPGVLETKHIEMVEALADQASLTLEHARLHCENRDKIEELQRSKKLIETLNARLEQDLNDTASNLEAIRESMKREHEEISLRYSYEHIIGKSPGIKKVLSVMDRFVDTKSSVFIYGESGTGKELIAQAFHYNSPRKGGPFIAENCASLADNLLESELFGHVRGAFTGADRDRIGLFQMAHKGTLFLDEVGDMSFTMQAKLLRVLQEGEVRPVGGRDYRKVEVRIITASHKDIRKMVAQNEFRQDLYYRLNVIRIDLPPLRERGEDILLLADHFLEKMAQEDGRRKPRLSKGAIRILLDYPWPGNIRELQNEIQRLLILGADVISPSLLSTHILEGAQTRKQVLKTGGLEAIIAPIEKKAILEALEQCQGNKVKAAQLLKIGRRTLYIKLKEYGISPHWGKNSGTAACQ